MSDSDAPRVVAFLPCRAGSERVPHKNTRPFGGENDGLLGIKLDQLLAAAAIDRVILDSNDPAVLAIGSRRADARGDGKLVVQARPDELGRSATSTDELIDYALGAVTGEVLLWTHVTSPFLDAPLYDAIVDAYDAGRHEGFDSLMTVTPHRTFLWTHEGPMNYDTAMRRWPRTQDIAPVFEVNSGAFVVPLELARERRDRIGERPKLFELGKLASFDIDWPDDFEVAELLWRAKRGAA